MEAPAHKNAAGPAGSTVTRILGVDPGLRVTGYGVLQVTRNGPQLCEAGVLRSTDRAPLSRRVAQLYDGIGEVLGHFRPVAMALEQLFSAYRHPRTAIQMGHARGVLCLAADQARINVVSYAPTQVKRLLTGSGRAPKAQVQQAVCRELALSTPPEPHDVTDALAVALCHYYAMSNCKLADCNLPGAR